MPRGKNADTPQTSKPEAQVGEEEAVEENSGEDEGTKEEEKDGDANEGMDQDE